MKELNLRPDEIHSAFEGVLFVFGIQIFMILFVLSVINGLVENVSFSVVLPDSIYTLGARFVCTILMHLQVEADVRQGLKMMKYVTNHSYDFMSPGTAFSIGMM